MKWYLLSLLWSVNLSGQQWIYNHNYMPYFVDPRMLFYRNIPHLTRAFPQLVKLIQDENRILLIKIFYNLCYSR